MGIVREAEGKRREREKQRGTDKTEAGDISKQRRGTSTVKVNF